MKLPLKTSEGGVEKLQEAPKPPGVLHMGRVSHGENCSMERTYPGMQQRRQERAMETPSGHLIWASCHYKLYSHYFIV
jgi:hypothetical protein